MKGKKLLAAILAVSMIPVSAIAVSAIDSKSDEKQLQVPVETTLEMCIRDSSKCLQDYEYCGMCTEYERKDNIHNRIPIKDQIERTGLQQQTGFFPVILQTSVPGSLSLRRRIG